MSKEEIQLKAELVRTREVIADKFKQSHDARTKRERELNETFAPVTKSIAKMIGRKRTSKKKLNAQNTIAQNNVHPYINNTTMTMMMMVMLMLAMQTTMTMIFKLYP